MLYYLGVGYICRSSCKAASACVLRPGAAHYALTISLWPLFSLN